MISPLVMFNFYSMKHKLKKKTIIHDIVFPQTFNQNINRATETIEPNIINCQNNKHRKLSKSNQKC